MDLVGTIAVFKNSHSVIEFVPKTVYVFVKGETSYKNVAKISTHLFYSNQALKKILRWCSWIFKSRDKY